jgi:hypothetical protein
MHGTVLSGGMLSPRGRIQEMPPAKYGQGSGVVSGCLPVFMPALSWHRYRHPWELVRVVGRCGSGVVLRIAGQSRGVEACMQVPYRPCGRYFTGFTILAPCSALECARGGVQIPHPIRVLVA